MKVLIIDDDPDIRMIVRLSLQMRPGWEVSEATDGAGGIQAALAGSHDLILLDANLDDMQGEDVLQALTSGPEGIPAPVLAITAVSDPVRKQDLLAAGARDILQKPFNPATLADQLEAALEQG